MHIIYILYFISKIYVYRMVVKQDVSLMSAEELSAYVEKVRSKRRERAKHYYDIRTYVCIYMYVCECVYVIRVCVCVYATCNITVLWPA